MASGGSLHNSKFSRRSINSVAPISERVVFVVMFYCLTQKHNKVVAEVCIIYFDLTSLVCFAGTRAHTQEKLLPCPGLTRERCQYSRKCKTYCRVYVDLLSLSSHILMLIRTKTETTILMNCI